MSWEEYDYGEEQAIDEDAAIEQVLGERPRARELRLMREALEERRAVFKLQRESEKDAARIPELNARILELGRQIEVLREEESITGFVESSVRATLNRPEDMEEY